LSKNIYKHFLLFHISCRLSSKNLAIHKNEHAKFLLKKFVAIASKLYGKQCLIRNMHSLIHLADDVKYMNCPMSNITAFSFESTLGKIKKLIRHGNKPLEQLCRRLNELFVNIKKPTIPSIIQILRQLRPDNFGNIPVIRIQFKNTILKNKPPNNTILINNNKILEINNMYIPVNEKNIQSMKITGIILKKNKPLYIHPCNTEIMKM